MLPAHCLIPQNCYHLVLGKRKEKVLVNCMKANLGRENRRIAPLIRNSGTRWKWAVSWKHRPLTPIIFAEVILNQFRLITFNHLALNSYIIFSFSFFHLGLLLHFLVPFFTLVTHCMFLWMNFQLSNRLLSCQLTFSWSTRLAIGKTFSVAGGFDAVSYFDKRTAMGQMLAGLLWHLLQSLLPLRNFRFAPKATEGSNT